MTDKMTCVSGCGKELVDDQYIPIAGYGNICGDCAFQLALMLIDALRRLFNKDVAVVEFTIAPCVTGGVQRVLRLFDGGRVAREVTIPWNRDSPWEYADALAKIIDKLQALLQPQTLKDVEAAIAKCAAEKQDLEKQRDLLYLKYKHEKA